MREIISLSGAKVVVSPRGEYVEGTTNRLVTITGSPTAAQTAHLFITQRLQVSLKCVGGDQSSNSNVLSFYTLFIFPDSFESTSKKIK